MLTQLFIMALIASSGCHPPPLLEGSRPGSRSPKAWRPECSLTIAYPYPYLSENRSGGPKAIPLDSQGSFGPFGAGFYELTTFVQTTAHSRWLLPWICERVRTGKLSGRCLVDYPLIWDITGM